MIKTILKSVREYKLPSILSPVIVTLEVFFEVLIPMICSDLLNFLQGNKSGVHIFAILGIDTGISITDFNADCLGYVLAYAGILVLMACLSLICGILAGKACAVASCGFAKNLREDLYHRIQEYSFENIDAFSTPSLITRLTTDVTNVQNAYMMLIRGAVRGPLMFVAALVMAFTKSWFLALIYLGVAVLLVVLMILLPGGAINIFRRVFRKYDKLNLRVQEDVRGARVVKSFVCEEREIQKFNDASEDIKKDYVKAETLLAFMGPVVNFMMYGLIIAVCLFAGVMIVETNSPFVDVVGTLNVGDLTALVQYATMILMSMIMLVVIYVMIVMSFESGNRIVQILSTNSSMTSPENGIDVVENGDIEFDNVDFSYSGDKTKCALTNVTLKIKSGESIGIIGATGSGKSTFVSMIPRLYDVTSGSVKVGGVDVKDYDLKSLRSSVAMVLQKNVLFSGSIKDNIRWGKLDATDDEIVEACRLAQADEFISAMPDGYDTHIEQGGTNVSGGQRQRLCIARALIANPKIIIFDDSTSAVDTRTDALIKQSLENSLPNTTKIIIAQRISSVENSDKIFVIDNGEIVGEGTHAELLRSNAIYKEAYQIQHKEVSKDAEA